MKRKKIWVAVILVLVITCGVTFAESDFLSLYASWFSPAAVTAAREATPVLKFEGDLEAAYRLGFAAGFDYTAKTEKNTFQFFSIQGEQYNPFLRAALMDVSQNDHEIVLSSDYVINLSTRKFHKPECSALKKMAQKNRVDFNGTAVELLGIGFSPCGICLKSLKNRDVNKN